MREIDKESLDFVVKNYKPNSLDTRKAIAKFRATSGTRNSIKRVYLAIGGVAALFFLFLLTRLVITPKNDWVNIDATNEIISYYMPDSSKVMLYPNSSISYNAAIYGDEKREVNMSGQVYFDVRSNKETPFKVLSKVAKVEVLGTQFQIEERDSATEVYVRSGRVKFSTMDMSSDIILTKNMSAQLNNLNNKIELSKANQFNPIAWVVGEFTYENTPIQGILNELSNFYGVELYCDSSDKELTATFSTDSLDEIIILIQDVLNIEIKKRDPQSTPRL